LNNARKCLKIALVLLLTLVVLTFTRDILRGSGLTIIFVPLITVGAFYWMFKIWKSNHKKEDGHSLHDQKTEANIVSEDKIVSPQVIGPGIANQTKLNDLPAINKTPNNYIPPTGESLKLTNPVESNNDFYAKAWDEINDQSKTPDKALWSKAFAFAQGDEKKAQAKYIELRVEKLLYEQNQLKAEIEKQKKELIKEELEW